MDRRLIRAINSGRCWVLVGSGPSCEMGYPSWNDLAEKTLQFVRSRGRLSDEQSYTRFLERRRFAELFRQAELDLGGRGNLIAFLNTLLVPSAERTDFVYSYLTKWPFACYLTTNYDDELSKHLGHRYTVLRNRREDIIGLRTDATHLIVKLHSDLDHPDEVVLTSEDYRRLGREDAYQYFRDKLQSVMSMCDLLIVGHSLADSDLGFVLEMARKTATPEHPIFMAAADLSLGDARELLENYNIVAIPYDNPDKKHTRLRRLLSSTNRYITPRHRLLEFVAAEATPEEEHAASALLIYRATQRLQGLDQDVVAEYSTPLLLRALLGVAAPGIDIETLLDRVPIRLTAARNPTLRAALPRILERLRLAGMVSALDQRFALTATGQARADELVAARTLEERQAFEHFADQIRNFYPQLSRGDAEVATESFRKAIVRVFRARGLSIANIVIAGDRIIDDDLSDVFQAVSDSAAVFANSDLRSAYADAAHQFLLEPSPPQQKYLTSVSQGFFLYHLVGLDPDCSRVRLEVFDGTLWICDASVLLPLLAEGSNDHDFVKDMFGRLRRLNARIITTTNLLREVLEHLNWAIELASKSGVQSLDFLYAARAQGGFRRNLFIEGFVRLSGERRVGSFEEYVRRLFPNGSRFNEIAAAIASVGIPVVDPNTVLGFDENDWAEIRQFYALIWLERSASGSLRSERQVEAEAEVLRAIRRIRDGHFELSDGFCPTMVYFLSHSRVLDRAVPGLARNTWNPEALYRYINALPGEQPDPALFQQCMLHEYYLAGVYFVDERRYSRHFEPLIRSARVSFDEQKAKYVQYTEDLTVEDLERAYETTPDLDKPFFASQVVHHTVELSEMRAEAAEVRAVTAETELRRLEASVEAEAKRRAKIYQRQEEARQRNLQDPKLRRKRQRQAKERARKKSKKGTKKRQN